MMSIEFEKQNIIDKIFNKLEQGVFSLTEFVSMFENNKDFQADLQDKIALNLNFVDLIINFNDHEYINDRANRRDLFLQLDEDLKKVLILIYDKCF